MGLRTRTKVWFTALAILAATLGLVALVGTASVTASPALFLLAGLAVFAAITALGAYVAAREVPPGRRPRSRLILAGGMILFGVTLFTLAVLLPMPDPRLAPEAVDGQQYWELTTGSRVAYVRLPAAGEARPEPVIFVHGGPAVADMKGDAEYFGQLTRDGFDVYVYDQTGTGRSSRLGDPRQYTLSRHVTELDEIRRQIGAERVVLIGHSWGALIAAQYMAEHGDRVARVVFLAPGPLPGTNDHSDRNLVGRLSLGEQLRVYELLVWPRAWLGYILLQVNPLAAHAFAGDAEMDARNDRIYNRTLPALHCRDEPHGRELHGLGFYAFQYPQSVTSPAPPDPRPALRGQQTPALVVKGSCDYLSWSSALTYRDLLPNAQLVYLPGAGHNVYQDRPDTSLSLIRAFLNDQPVPLAPVTGSDVPADYEGPP